MTYVYAWVPLPVGMALAGAIALGGVLLARAWESELLAVVAVLTSLYPAVTVVLARVLLAERWRGKAADMSNFLVLTIGTGIGGAVLIEGHLLRGRYGIAGEFGHMQVVPGGQRCECGNRGCWEQYSSGNALVREARTLALANSPMATDLLARVGGDLGQLTGPMITDAARSGDPIARELLGEIGHWLGVGIANLAAAIDPEVFVIGGGVSAAGDMLLGPAQDTFARQLTGRGYRPAARIVEATLGPDAGLVGAATLGAESVREVAS